MTKPINPPLTLSECGREILDAEGRVFAYMHFRKRGAPEAKPVLSGKVKAAHIILCVNRHDKLVAALEEIKKGDGAFSRDPLEHAGNLELAALLMPRRDQTRGIDGMKAIAEAALQEDSK